jgi:hypothetical protein
MENYHFAVALRSAQLDGAYWQEQFQSAIASNDRDGAAEALRLWRQCRSLIAWLEGTVGFPHLPE